MYRKPAEECYNYIKKNYGGLSTQKACTATPNFNIETINRGAYIASTHKRPLYPHGLVDNDFSILLLTKKNTTQVIKPYANPFTMALM